MCLGDGVTFLILYCWCNNNPLLFRFVSFFKAGQDALRHIDMDHLLNSDLRRRSPPFANWKRKSDGGETGKRKKIEASKGRIHTRKFHPPPTHTQVKYDRVIHQKKKKKKSRQKLVQVEKTLGGVLIRTNFLSPPKQYKGVYSFNLKKNGNNCHTIIVNGN